MSITNISQLTASTTCLTTPLYRQYKVSNLYSSLLVRIHSSLSPEHLHQSLVSLPQLSASTCQLYGSHLCHQYSSINHLQS